MNNLNEITANMENLNKLNSKSKGNYVYPKLKTHKDHEALIANRLAKEEEDRKKKLELERIEYERKMMQIEDINCLPEVNDDEHPEEESDDSY